MSVAERKISPEKQMNVKKFEEPEASTASHRMNFTIRFTNVQRNYSMEKPHPGICNGINFLVLVMSRRVGGGGGTKPGGPRILAGPRKVFLKE